MKKLMLSVLAVFGLTGAQIQAGFGAKAMNFAANFGNPAAQVATGLSIAAGLFGLDYGIDKFNGKADNAIEQAKNANLIAADACMELGMVRKELGGFKAQVDKVLEAPMVSKLLDSQKVPETWFGNHLLDGKLWYGVKWLNAGVIATGATIQTYLGILHIYQQMKQAMIAQQPQAERQPTLEEINEYIAEQRAVQEQQRRQAAAVNPHRGHAGRSRIVTRR